MAMAGVVEAIHFLRDFGHYLPPRRQPFPSDEFHL
jgi:hypothetical protein